MTRLLVSCRFAPYSETPRLAVRHGLDCVELDTTWTDSFAPGAWLAGGKGATVQLDHDTEPVGSVVVVAARGRWWVADLVVETDDPEVLARIKPGTGVSLGARSLGRDEDMLVRTRRHTLAQLEHIAILKRGQIPVYQGAKITSVTEAKARTKPAPASGIDWRSQLPREYADFAEESIDLQPGDELVRGSRLRGLRWDGQRFTQPHARAA